MKKKREYVWGEDDDEQSADDFDQRPTARRPMSVGKSKRADTPANRIRAVLNLLPRVRRYQQTNESAQDFCDGVERTLLDMLSSISGFDGRATDRQMNAVRNIELGLRRWMR